MVGSFKHNYATKINDVQTSMSGCVENKKVMKKKLLYNKFKRVADINLKKIPGMVTSLFNNSNYNTLR